MQKKLFRANKPFLPDLLSCKTLVLDNSEKKKYHPLRLFPIDCKRRSKSVPPIQSKFEDFCCRCDQVTKDYRQYKKAIERDWLSSAEKIEYPIRQQQAIFAVVSMLNMLRYYRRQSMKLA